MSPKKTLPKPKLLFTPGPLTTSGTVKEAMLKDYGSRDQEFIQIIKEIRTGLLEAAGVSQAKGYEAVLIQGSGTFGIESVITSAVPEKGHLLVIINGEYGERILKIAEIARIRYSVLRYHENQVPPIKDLEGLLKNEPITHIAMVHCETTTGIINPIKEFGLIANRLGKIYIVDAMSSFGGIPINVADCKIDYLISSSNKCLEGVPGFSFVIAKADALLKTSGNARTLSLDLYAQWIGLEKNGQFRFTPPTHAMVAFHQALKEFNEEGGVEARATRYRKNYEILVAGMRQLGFKEYLEPEKQGYIITSFYYPRHPNFSFEKFYELLSEKGFAIYPGKLSKVDCFRIGNIGQLFQEDMKALLSAIKITLLEMEVKLELEVHA